MSKPNGESKKAGPEEAGASESVDEAADGEETSGEAGAVETEADTIARLEAELAQVKDQLLRTLAESENQRRRSQREREESVRYAPASLARDMLAVADNLTRAIESVPEEAVANDEALRNLLDGVRLTDRELQAAFERHNIVKLEPLGEPLDPHRHEAMFEVPDAGAPAGTIVQVLQSGYLLHDRLLRAARVGVAKGAAAASSGEQADGGDPDQEDEAGSGGTGRRVDTSA